MSDAESETRARTSKDEVLLGDLRGGLCSSVLCRQLRAVAADEIERLRAALERIAERPSGYHDCGDYERGYGQCKADMATIVRAALTPQQSETRDSPEERQRLGQNGEGCGLQAVETSERGT